MLQARIATAAVVVAVLFPVLIWGRTFGVSLLVASFGSIAVWELASCLPGTKLPPSREIAVALFLGMVLFIYHAPLQGTLGLIALLPLLVLVIHLALFKTIDDTVGSASQMMLVLGYVAIPLCHAILLSRLTYGIAWVFFVLVVNSLGDAGAYFAGKKYGAHRFSTEISPSKTLEGLQGGVIGAFVGMLIMKILVPGMASFGLMFILTIGLAIAGPLGDFTASAIKRKIGIKDFGSFLPGHGGVMDRADSLIFVLPITYYFLMLSGR